MIAPYPPCPNPDKVALLRTGNHVRKRLGADPFVERLPTEQAEIWAVADFVNAEECTQLMAMIDRTAKPSAVLDHGYQGQWRTSYSGDVDRYDPFVQMIERRIDDLLGIPHEWGETMQGQRYLPGQEFREHQDWFWTKAPYWKTEAKRGGQRSITAMIYLNNVEEGGETDFKNVGLAIPPQAGALIIWNNATPTGDLNNFTLHAGTPVIKGVKYVITKWYRTRKWG
ncbi:prolyl hydroxylase family protein [Novosphingobium sp.]|uniref:prolyl hydroxylase family protein n=1 Tax=Novosphingobium sp. TaxID=1874826 RepID=UPI0035B2A33D